MILINKNDVLSEIEYLLKECKRKENINKYKSNKIREIRKILLFSKNFLTVENLKPAKRYTLEDDINILANHINYDIDMIDIDIMNITFEDKILDENKIILNKLTNINTDFYFYISTNICIYYDTIVTQYNIYIKNFSTYEFVLQYSSLKDNFKSFIKKEASIRTKTVFEYITNINKKTYDIKDCFLNMNISKKQFLEYLYKTKIDNKIIKKITGFSDVFFSSNNKITISNLYEFVEILETASERRKIMYIISNIVCGK